MKIEKTVVVEENVEKIVKAEDAFTIFKAMIGEQDLALQEHFIAITLGQDSRPITAKVLFKGTLNQTLVHPRDIFRVALEDNAAGVIIMHNHPSGSLEPSRADDRVTQRIKEAGNLLGITLLDHVIVTNDGYMSYSEECLL